MLVGRKAPLYLCGLNVDGMQFRTKPADRVRENLLDLTKKWGVGRVHFSDNILPRQFFDDLLPALAELPERPRLFFEVKANLRDDELQLMQRAGIDTIQPGIELFSSHVLKLMRKGVSGPQNMRLLRAAKSNGIQVVWNYLYGFPGERREDYEAALVLIPKIEHLNPPSGLNRLIVDRYSPYHFDHVKFGIETIQPFKSYTSIYPAGTSLAEIAYHFNGDYTTPLLDDPALLTAMRRAVALWKNRWENVKPRLSAIPAKRGRTIVADTRALATEAMTPLSQEAAAALLYFSKPRPREGLHEGHDDQIDELVARHFLIEHENALLSVVTGFVDSKRARSSRQPHLCRPSGTARRPPRGCRFSPGAAWQSATSGGGRRHSSDADAVPVASSVARRVSRMRRSVGKRFTLPLDQRALTFQLGLLAGQPGLQLLPLLQQQRDQLQILDRFQAGSLRPAPPAPASPCRLPPRSDRNASRRARSCS